MGTRAIITIEGKPFLATHWDGDPASLGQDLKATKLSKKEIIDVAKRHTIDAADINDDDIKKIREERFKKISEKTKGKYSVAYLKNLAKKGRQITFGVMTPEDYDVGDIKNYDDFAEYKYDIRNGKVYVKPLSGTWKETKNKKDLGEVL